MFNGSPEFGKAYQDELRRIAGVSDELEFEGLKLSRSREPGILSRLFNRLLARRRDAHRAAPKPLQEPNRTFNKPGLTGEL